MTQDSRLPGRGSLSEHPLPKILVALYQQRTSCALELTRGRTRKRILLRDGAPVSADSNLAGESLAVQLRESGILTPEQHDELVSISRRKRCGEGPALLALRWIEPRALFPALVEQLRRRVLECFSWPGGGFRVDASAVPPDDARALRCDPYRLIQEGLATHWSVERLLADLGPRLGQFPNPTRSFAALLSHLKQAPAIEALCQALDGDHTFGHALGRGANSPDVLAAAWLLDATGAVRFSQHARRDTEADEAEIEIASLSGAGAPPSVGAMGSDAGRGDRPPKPPACDESGVERLREEVIEQRARLSEVDHYTLLGVEADASPAAVKTAYFTAAKRYHPDALRRLGLADIQEDAAEVFSCVRDAYEVLSNPAKRQEYDAALEHGNADTDANRLAQAETFFRKGEILVRMGDFRGAIQYLESAVEVWPEEAEYQAILGWSLYKKAPPEPERARLHLQRALDLDPNDAESRSRLELVLRDLNS